MSTGEQDRDVPVTLECARTPESPTPSTPEPPRPDRASSPQAMPETTGDEEELCSLHAKPEHPQNLKHDLSQCHSTLGCSNHIHQGLRGEMR